MKWLHITFGEGNAIERYFRALKERSEQRGSAITSMRVLMEFGL
ncbi:MAG: hypothetical protein QXE12_02695 [Conexivisphaerales archaeon]